MVCPLKSVFDRNALAIPIGWRHCFCMDNFGILWDMIGYDYLERSDLFLPKKTSTNPTFYLLNKCNRFYVRFQCFFFYLIKCTHPFLDTSENIHTFNRSARNSFNECGKRMFEMTIIELLLFTG